MLGEETVKFTASVADNFNLHVKFAGNDPKKLILDEQGMPTNSVIVSIDSIKMEDVNITEIAYNQSKFNINASEKYIEEYLITECMDLGLHGVWTMHIQSPVYIWMLENL